MNFDKLALYEGYYDSLGYRVLNWPEVITHVAYNDFGEACEMPEQLIVAYHFEGTYSVQLLGHHLISGTDDAIDTRHVIESGVSLHRALLISYLRYQQLLANRQRFFHQEKRSQNRLEMESNQPWQPPCLVETLDDDSPPF